MISNSNSKTNDENASSSESKKPNSTISVDTSSNNKPSLLRANPLSAFSSSTYNISLYMINPDTYNLYAAGGKTIPKDWKLICRSGGINNSNTDNNRADGFELDYYIDNLKIVSAISSKETYTACNSFDFSFNIIEPYGFSFPTKLVKAATKVQAASTVQRKVNESITALQTHYLLVIRFYGYDKDGKVITSNDYPMADKNASDPSAVFERSFPIAIYGFDFKLDPKMVTYHVKAKLISEQSGLSKSALEIPEDMTVQGETVQDVLQGSDDNNKNQNAVGLIQRLNEIQQHRLDNNMLEVKDVYKIQFEPNTGIADAKLVDVKNNPNEKSANAKVASAAEVNIKTSSKPAVIRKLVRPIGITAGDNILQAIDQIITQSSYVTGALQITTSEEYQQPKETDPSFTKNIPNVIGWYVVIPSTKLLDFDKTRNVFATEITYIIKRYEVPYIRGVQLGKRTPYYGPVKRYKHWFMSTGEKTHTHQKEIISYDVTYNLLYFNLAGYGTNAPLTDTDDTAPVVNLSGGSNPTGKAPGWFDKVVSPVKTFLYSPADQLKAKIVILGDPDYLMTSTSKGYQEAITKWFGTDQSINPNSGQVFIEIDFRTVEDYASSSDKKGAGLLNPSQEGDILFWKYPDSIKKDVEGVIYMVWQVISTFNKGIFQQELKVCIPPFVSDQPDNSDSKENDREIASLLGRYPASNPTAFNNIAPPPTATSTNTLAPITLPNSQSFAKLSLDPNQLTSTVINNNTLPGKSNSTFGIANDELTYAANSKAVDDGGREA